MREIAHHYEDLGDVKIHYVVAGSGPVVVLIHGWPQTWYTWRHLIHDLAKDYTVIAPDLRGLGDSSRPELGYDKKTVAGDIWTVISEINNINRFHLVGHDWGGAVAYALASEHPDAVVTLSILDVVIPKGSSARFSQGGKRWHHAFHLTPDLPEALTQGREELYLRWFFQNFGATPNAISEEDAAEYIRCYSRPGRMQAGFEYYRALPMDIQDNELNPVLTMPVLALGGAESWGRRQEVFDSLSELAGDVTGGVIEGAGHWIPEEQPEVLAQKLRAFFESKSKK